MKFKVLHQYGKDVDTVFRLFYIPILCRKNMSVLVPATFPALECSGQRGLPALESSAKCRRRPPGLLKKFPQSLNTLVQSEQWQGAAGGPTIARSRLKLPAYLVSVGEMSCAARTAVVSTTCGFEAGAAWYSGRWQPPDFVGGDAEKAIQAEYEFIRGRLADETGPGAESRSPCSLMR